jgi:hypothetical protein
MTGGNIWLQRIDPQKCRKKCRNCENNDKTIHWKALEELFLVLPFVVKVIHPRIPTENITFFISKICKRKKLLSNCHHVTFFPVFENRGTDRFNRNYFSFKIHFENTRVKYQSPKEVKRKTNTIK